MMTILNRERGFLMTKRKSEKPKDKPEEIKKKHAGGRPKIPYTKEMANRIYFLISTQSKGIKQICRENPEIPGHETIFSWIHKISEFSELYLKAKQEQVMAHMEETYEIADDDSRDSMMDDYGNVKMDTEYVSRAKLRIELRKWQAARLMPKLFGDKIITEGTVTVRHEDALKELA